MTSRLALLIGQKIKEINTGFSSVYPLDSSEKFDLNASILVHTKINFEEYTLSIFNKHELKSKKNHAFIDTIGETVISILETEFEALIKLGNKDIIRINLEDDAYNDPEAMCLHGPNDLCIVWN